MQYMVRRLFLHSIIAEIGLPYALPAAYCPPSMSTPAPARETAPCDKRKEDGTSVEAALYDSLQAPAPLPLVSCSAATASIAAGSATALAFAAPSCEAR